jgi:cytochrome c oxidase subunit II
VITPAHPVRRGLRPGRWGVWLTAPLVLAGCGGNSPSAFSTGGPGAATVATLAWVLIGFSVVTIAAVVLPMLWAARRRRGRDVGIRPGDGKRFVVVAGVVVPAFVLAAVYGLGVHDMSALSTSKQDAKLTVDVIGHVWWWEVRYPDRSIVTANEIHIPVGQVVHLRLTTADVNHSFWVPQLMPKTDLVAGRVNETWLDATKAGTYRGQCAEYCGLQHAHMAFLVVAQPTDEFQAWARTQAADAATPADATQTRGRQVFEGASCATCHTIRGTTATGHIGPDLTHLASRQELAAGAIPNTRGYLGGWISNSQAVKPGNKMPPQQLPPEDLQALLTYLGSLK